MSKTLIHFEAKSIQKYILDSSKLKDMIGASEQIENLCAEGGLLDEVLATLALQPEYSRRVGGAFTLFFDNPQDAERFYALWSFCVQQQLPGLVFVLHQQADVQETALKIELTEELPRRLEQVRNRLFPQFPVPGPLVARARRGSGFSGQGKPG